MCAQLSLANEHLLWWLGPYSQTIMATSGSNITHQSSPETLL